jgi:hypothetical protein
MEIPDGDLCLIRNNYRDNLGFHTQSLTDCVRELSRAALAQELVRRQEFCHLAMGGLERLDGAVQIKIGVPDRCEKFSRQRQIELNAGCAIAAFAAVK